MSRTALYRLFSTDGSLLYIGVTLDPEKRFAAHAYTKKWWPEVDPIRTRIEWFDDRATAESAELAAIRVESPRYNIVTSDAAGCARFLPDPTGRRWGRPVWLPSSSEPLLIEQAQQAWREVAEAEDRAWRATAALREGGIPDLVICERIEQVSRATLNRRLGPRQQKQD